MSDIQTHLRKLGRINKGDDVRSVARSDRINAMQELIKSMLRGDNIVTDRNVIKKRSSEGLMALTTSPAPRSFGTRGPFEIILQENGQYQITPGTVNDIIPENIFTLLPYDIGATTYAVLHVFTDNYAPTRITIESRTAPPDPPGHLVNVAPEEFYVIIGIVAYGLVYQVVNYNINATPIVVIQTLTETPEPGRPYYDLNYSWRVASV